MILYINMVYKGSYNIKNPQKYEGDISQIYYRSGWELSFMLWCDNNPDILKWSSETVVIPYLCPIDNKIHSYFVDFKVKFKNGSTYLIEIKPKKQTIRPKLEKNKITRKYLNEVLTYIKNGAKWKAAEKYCEARDWKFNVWTEETLNKMGIKILGT